MAIGVLGNSAILGLIGSIAGRYLQARSAALAAEAEQRSRDIASAQKVFDQLSPLLDTRLFLARAVAATFDKSSGISKEEAAKRWAAYEQKVVEMDGRVNLTRAELCVHFGKAILDQYDADILSGFAKSRQYLRDGRDKPFQDADFQKNAANLQDLIFKFNAALMQQIVKGEVGSRAPGATPALPQPGAAHAG